MRPPYRSTMRLQIARPKPVPGNSSSCRRLKRPKIRSAYCCSKPMPLSPTDTVQFAPLASARMRIAGAASCPAILQRVRKQILKNVARLRGVSTHRRQPAFNGDAGAMLFDPVLEHSQRLVERLAKVGCPHRQLIHMHRAGEGQQVVDQGLHAKHAMRGRTPRTGSPRAFQSEVLEHQLGVNVDHAQRLLEIVARHMANSSSSRLARVNSWLDRRRSSSVRFNP